MVCRLMISFLKDKLMAIQRKLDTNIQITSITQLSKVTSSHARAWEVVLSDPNDCAALLERAIHDKKSE